MLQELADAEARAQQGLARIPESSKTTAYQAWLGFYNSFKSKLRWTPAELVQQANYFSQTIGQYTYIAFGSHTLKTTFNFSPNGQLSCTLHFDSLLYEGTLIL